MTERGVPSLHRTGSSVARDNALIAITRTQAARGIHPLDGVGRHVEHRRPGDGEAGRRQVGTPRVELVSRREDRVVASPEPGWSHCARSRTPPSTAATDIRARVRRTLSPRPTAWVSTTSVTVVGDDTVEPRRPGYHAHVAGRPGSANSLMPMIARIAAGQRRHPPQPQPASRGGRRAFRCRDLRRRDLRSVGRTRRRPGLVAQWFACRRRPGHRRVSLQRTSTAPTS